MTREEHLEGISKFSVGLHSEVVKVIVNKIYDDFESRICENCKHYHADMFCISQKVNNMMDEFQQLDFYVKVDKTFGCGEYETPR